MKYDDPRRQAMDAHTALELFDLAAALMERVRGPASTQRTASAIAARCRRACHAELAHMDKAIAKTALPEQSPRMECTHYRPAQGGTACGRGLFPATYDRNKVTCKQCLAALIGGVRPRKSRNTRGVHK